MSLMNPANPLSPFSMGNFLSPYHPLHDDIFTVHTVVKKPNQVSMPQHDQSQSHTAHGELYTETAQPIKPTFKTHTAQDDISTLFAAVLIAWALLVITIIKKI